MANRHTTHPHLTHFTDAEFETYERRTTSVRLSEIEYDPGILGHDFNLEHLQAVHHHILQDVYPWAGVVREQQTWAMGIDHIHPDHVAEYMTVVTEAMAEDRPHPGQDRHEVIEIACEYWALLTQGHAFVDGNSRTQRAYIQLYLREAGLDIDWRVLDPESVHAARHASFLLNDQGERDPSWLVAQIEPGVVDFGQGSSLAHDASVAEHARSIKILQAMIEAQEEGIDGYTFRERQSAQRSDPSEPAVGKSTSPSAEAAGVAGRGITRTPLSASSPTGDDVGSSSSVRTRHRDPGLGR